MNKNKKLQELELALNSLVIFRRLLTNEVMVPLRQLLDTEMTDPVVQLRQYAEFVARLYPHGTDLTDYLLRIVLEDDNFYMRMLARGEQPNEQIDLCAKNELLILQRLSRLRPAELQKEISYYGVLPEWTVSEIDFGLAYADRVRDIARFGYGQFAKYRMFWLRDGRIVPVLHPDPVLPETLCGYTRERSAVEENLLLLLDGRPAQNVLLCGDAGTGKSATVKALVNAYADRGLRLIQIPKEQLHALPEVADEIAENPLKFIIYIDGLTFSPAEPLPELKAMLEGSVSALPANAVICATGNLTKLPEEPEQRSLLGRFGLRVEFDTPDKDTYLEIVQELAQRSGLEPGAEGLADGAEAFAKEGAGRSPRTARQFIERMTAERPPEGKDQPEA